MRARGRLPSLTLVLLLWGCEAPPPQAPKVYVPTEADASAAFEDAKTKGTTDALFAVYRKFPQQPSGKAALVLASKKIVDDVDERLAKCDEDGAKESAGRLGPLTLVDPAIDKAYDATEQKIIGEHERCQLGRLDADVEKLAGEWRWPELFSRIIAEKEVSGAKLKERRVAAIDRWKKFVDGTVRGILAKKSLEGVSDKRARLLEAVSTALLPAELATDAQGWAPSVQLLLLVYGDMKDGQLLDPPKRYKLAVDSKSRKLETPAIEDGPVLASGLVFQAIAKGKLSEVEVLVVGKPDKDAMVQLSSGKLVVPLAGAKTW